MWNLELYWKYLLRPVSYLQETYKRRIQHQIKFKDPKSTTLIQHEICPNTNPSDQRMLPCIADPRAQREKPVEMTQISPNLPSNADYFLPAFTHIILVTASLAPQKDSSQTQRDAPALINVF